MAGPSISAKSIKLLDSVTIYTNSVLQLYEIYYKIGDEDFVKIAAGVYKSCTWTPPIDLMGKVTSDGTECTIRCRRNLLVYTDLAITLYPPDSALPVVSDGWFTATADNSGGAASQISVEFVKNYSKARITFDSSKIATQYGSSIAELSVTYNGVKKTAVSNVATTDILIDSAAVLLLSVTDSNGVRKDVLHTINTLPYYPVTLTNVSANRSDNQGEPMGTGRYIAVQATAACTSLNGKNTVTLTAQYKENGAEDYGSPITVPSGELTVINPSSPIEISKSYFVKLTAVDKLGSKAEFVTQIQTASVAIHLANGGNAIGIGKYAEQDDTIESALNVQVGTTNSNKNLVVFGEVKTKRLSINGTPLIDYIYPVGSIYSSANNTSPSTLFGGTWTAVTGIGSGIYSWQRTS